MQFVNRMALGGILSDDVAALRGKNAIIVCLKESSLLTCLSMAIKLRAWVFPLVVEPIYAPGPPRRLLGAVDSKGNFYFANEGQPSADGQQIEALKPTAVKLAQQKAAAYDMDLDPRRLDGRDLIFVGDVMTDTLLLSVALQMLKTLRPKSVTTIIGNASAPAAELARLTAAKTQILDVLPGVTMDDDHYFQHPDDYDTGQKQLITKHIAAYWQ